jgi:hypothetical protein
VRGVFGVRYTRSGLSREERIDEYVADIDMEPAAGIRMRAADRTDGMRSCRDRCLERVAG